MSELKILNMGATKKNGRYHISHGDTGDPDVRIQAFQEVSGKRRTALIAESRSPQHIRSIRTALERRGFNLGQLQGSSKGGWWFNARLNHKISDPPLDTNNPEW